jgi:hypothetical protein
MPTDSTTTTLINSLLANYDYDKASGVCFIPSLPLFLLTPSHPVYLVHFRVWPFAVLRIKSSYHQEEEARAVDAGRESAVYWYSI